MTGLTDPERLALAYIVDVEAKTIRRAEIRDKLASLIGRLSDIGNPIKLSNIEEDDLAYRARREIETNRYPLALHLEPLRTAFAELAPADVAPVSPKPQRGGSRKRR